METRELKRWLKSTAWDRVYWSLVRERARAIKADGCSGVPDWMVWTCYEHDIHYRYHMTLEGGHIDKAQADYCLRVRIQQGSAMGVLSPVSWWRWAGVRVLPPAQTAWDHAWLEP